MWIRVSVISPISKIAPRDMRCSSCPALIKRGTVYVKTGHGRYCESCGDNLVPYQFPIVQEAAIQPGQ